MTDQLPNPTGPARRGIRDLLLDAGAKLLQRKRALLGFDAYLVGFHCAKDEPNLQREVHYFCKQVNEDFLQCLLFDDNTEHGKLVGVEYIISERLYATLPRVERSSWHPHNHEILSGQVVAPTLPAAAEKALLALLLNSYGKCWQLWDPWSADEELRGVPVGPARLMWSFNRDGQLRADLEGNRNWRFAVDVIEKRRQRADLAEHAHAQDGVDVLAAAFPKRETRELPGVVDVSALTAGEASR